MIRHAKLWQFPLYLRSLYQELEPELCIGLANTGLSYWYIYVSAFMLPLSANIKKVGLKDQIEATYGVIYIIFSVKISFSMLPFNLVKVNC